MPATSDYRTLSDYRSPSRTPALPRAVGPGTPPRAESQPDPSLIHAPGRIAIVIHGPRRIMEAGRGSTLAPVLQLIHAGPR